jgi:zinc and cadmium transporter
MFVNTFFLPLLATFIISLVSLVGVLFLAINNKILEKILLLLVGFSAGALMGDAFIHLIPEGLETVKADTFFLCVLGGIVLFLCLERFIHWRHCHQLGGNCEGHVFAYTNLIGDALHNFIDGLVIAASFSISIELGVATFLAVLFHEIPQEISDFGVLLYSGLSKKKAILFNFLSALLAVLGCLIGIFLFQQNQNISGWLIGLTAGGFIYISASDLVPEMHKKSKGGLGLWPFTFFFIGLGFMYLIKNF